MLTYAKNYDESLVKSRLQICNSASSDYLHLDTHTHEGSQKPCILIAELT